MSRRSDITTPGLALNEDQDAFFDDVPPPPYTEDDAIPSRGDTEVKSKCYDTNNYYTILITRRRWSH
jgi:hypothetical protein